MNARSRLAVKRLLTAAVIIAQVYALFPNIRFKVQEEEHTNYAFAATVVCPSASPHFQAANSSIALSNAYWYPTANGTNLLSGATTINFANFTNDTTGGGLTYTPQAGDELLIMQMQDGSGMTTSNTSSYGTYSSLGQAGLYEYVSITSYATGTATIQGTGTGGGLLNSYSENTANNQRYQIIMVPQYSTATLTGNFRAAYWDGNTGGVAAIDVDSTLNLGGASIYATGDGFRGGGLSVSSTSPASVLNNDYVDSATMNGTGQPAFGTKGEGVGGSPHSTFYYTNFSTPSAPAAPTVAPSPGGSDGYTGGDQGMGAPINAGGGGTDEDPANNDQNTGGGGGGNGGAGGKGGYPWTPSYSGNTSLYALPGVHTAPGTGGYSAANSADVGGRGGASLSSSVSVSRIFMGGGGGSGSNNNASNNNSYNAYGSSGGVGGGIVMMRLADVSGSPAKIYANGTTGLAPDNDGGGGGGAGGTVLITSPTAFSNISVNVNGAAGTTAAGLSSDAFPGMQHGPGGGGGGGVVITTSAVTVNNAGGANGTTTASNTTYGATSGAAGVTLNGTVTADQIPGVGSGAQCGASTGTSGSATLYTGPYDPNDTALATPNGYSTPYTGAEYTGSYDGKVGAGNDNDFTARPMPLSSPNPSPQNQSTTGSALSPIGNTFSTSTGPVNSIEHSLYYMYASKNKYHAITVTASAPVTPTGWTVQVCPDSGSNAPNCAFTTTAGGTCSPNANQWVTSVSTAAATNSMTYCYFSQNVNGGAPQLVKYWTVYTGPTGTYTAFARYDAVVTASDDQASPAMNRTHDELYAGYIPVGKSSTVISSGCPGTNQGTTAGVCAGGVIQYTVNYANIVAGGGMGTEGQALAPFPAPSPGSLKITDDGSANGSNWATYTNGLTEALSAGLTTSTQANCGKNANSCGDTTAGTTCTYTGAGGSVTVGTKFVCTIGGSSFQLFPPGLSGKTSSGSLVFAVKAK